MVIELSSLKFTNKADIVPESGTDEILNTGIVNTLDGKDVITGTGTGSFSILNYGTINTDDGNDIITGIRNENKDTIDLGGAGVRNEGGTINTGDGNDIIIGTGRAGDGIFTNISSINTGDGNDIITGTAIDCGINVNYHGTIDTGNGNDVITGTGAYGIANYFTINTGDGNDKITGTGTGTMTGGYGIVNVATIDTGAGNDIITGNTNNGWGIFNYSDSTINTGDGNDTITGTSSWFGINNRGTINTGNGNDSIIADGGFNGMGNLFLGDGKDYLKGFGNGNFNGGNDKDTLELMSGTYTVGISGTIVSFTNGSTIMNTSDFEKLIAGSKTYDFNHLTNDQTIIV